MDLDIYSNVSMRVADVIFGYLMQHLKSENHYQNTKDQTKNKKIRGTVNSRIPFIFNNLKLRKRDKYYE